VEKAGFLPGLGVSILWVMPAFFSSFSNRKSKEDSAYYLNSR
jgi:hypothetical protein